MKKLLFAIIVLATLTLTSCAPLNLGSRMKTLEIGMTKQEVTSILGNQYSTEGAVRTPEGALETIYYSNQVSSDFTLHFLDGRLVEWYRGVRPPTAAPMHH